MLADVRGSGGGIGGSGGNGNRGLRVGDGGIGNRVVGGDRGGISGTGGDDRGGGISGKGSDDRGGISGKGSGGRGEELRLTGVSVFGNQGNGDARPLLEDIDLALHPGEWLNVAGVNGSGKSTLARLIAGLHAEGRVGAIQRGFAGVAASPIVLQRPEVQLFGETPREEVMFALEWRNIPSELIEERVNRALEAVGLSALADIRWDRLSGGQRQLAAVAAASSLGAPLIVYDEATSMLDDANRRAVLECARSLHAAGTAVVWVTQRLDELLPEDRTIALAGGRIVFDGPARSFFYGDGSRAASPCERCGLRLPFMASLALELAKSGRLAAPLPVTAAEWREVELRG